MKTERGFLRVDNIKNQIEFNPDEKGNVIAECEINNKILQMYKILNIDPYKESEHEQVTPRNVNVGNGAMNGNAVIVDFDDVLKQNPLTPDDMLKEHVCKYCGALTDKPDKDCYKAPQFQKTISHAELKKYFSDNHLKGTFIESIIEHFKPNE